jgi:transcriptional regulator with PAS, ATPase and Fis domain
VVAATNKDPVQAVRGGAFREDLFYRLNVFSVAMPPLRQRKDDIPLLVEAFIEEFNAKYDKRVKGVDDAALQRLIRWHWPGNVRELRNAIERAVVGCSGDLVAPDCLPVAAPGQPAAQDGEDAVLIRVGTTLDDAEQALLRRTLASVGNNKTRAAEILGITPKTLRSKLGRSDVPREV